MLEDILKDRFVPEPSSNLAYRIIEAAKPRNEEKGLALAGIWSGFCELFVIPQPAFAMAVILLIGLSVGSYYTTEQDMTVKMATENFSTFTTAELSVDYGDFQ